MLTASGQVALAQKRSLWPKPVFDDDACHACDACVIACPVGCLDLEYRPHRTVLRGLPTLVDEAACIACGLCEAACLYEAVRLQPRRAG